MDIKDQIVQELGLAIGSDDGHDEALPPGWESLWTVFKIDGNDLTEFGHGSCT